VRPVRIGPHPSRGAASMLIGDVPPTAWDLHFSIGSIPVRISPFFWLFGLFFLGGGDLSAMLAGIAAILLSILIHELGHALAFAHFGIASSIVLYYFGGLAIPDVSAHGMGRASQLRPMDQIIISAAGPLVQLAVAILIAIALAMGGFELPIRWPWLEAWIPVTSQHELPPVARLFLGIFLYVSTFWAVFNLLPVFPLDGGQIARELFLISGQPQAFRNSTLLSVATALIVVLHSIATQNVFLVIMFGSLAFSNYQDLQGIDRFRSRGPW